MKFKSNEVKEGNSIVLKKARNSDTGDARKIVILPEEEEKHKRITYLVEVDSKVIGKIRVDISDDEGFLSGFGILPEYRNQGYGKQTLKSILALLIQKNINNIALEVATKNKNALHLYQSCGFEEESVTDYYEV